MRIRITKTPPGFAPEWVRQAWVGLTLESTGLETLGSGVHFNRKGQENLGGYEVQSVGAFAALLLHNPEACDWWEENCPEAALGTMVFHKDVCEPVPIRIRITKIPHPNGENPPPEWVRECWVGMELETSGLVVPNDFCVVIGQQTPHGYRVSGAMALEALKLHNKEEAHKWWMTYHPKMASSLSITFCRGVCEEVL